jgi:hypothetical protein
VSILRSTTRLLALALVLGSLASVACARAPNGPAACACTDRLAQRTDQELARATGEGLPPAPRLDRTISLGAVDTPSATGAATSAPPSARGGGPPAAVGPTVPILTTEPGGVTTGDMGTGTTESFVGPAGTVAPAQGAAGLAPAR